MIPRHGRSPSVFGTQQSSQQMHQQHPTNSHGPPGGGSIGGAGAGPRPPLPLICCNRCRKPLATTVFLLPCDCVFCEDCTYSHFSTSTNCPNCRRVVDGKDDLLELVVADPSKSQQEYSKNLLQTMFTKRVSNKQQALTFSDLCSRMMRNFEDNRRAMQFLLKQLIHETGSSQSRSLDAQRTRQQIKEEFTQFQQSSAAEKEQFEQTIENLQNKLKALAVELAEYKTQNQHFRTMIEQKSATHRSPSSSQSQGSGGGGKRLPSNSSQNKQRSLLSGFVMNAQGRPQPQQHGAMHMNRPMMQHSRPSTSSRSEPLMTPIQTHTTTTSYRVGGAVSSFTSTAGYVFSSPGGTKSGQRYHDENAIPNLHAPPPPPPSQYQRTQHHPSPNMANAMPNMRAPPAPSPSQYQRTQHHPSPNMAFAYNTAGGVRTSSSRASTFQFHPYNQGGMSNGSYAPGASSTQYH